MPLFTALPVGLKNYVQITHTEEFVKIFNYLSSLQTDILYNHSRIYPFAYLNVGQYSLYLNKDFCEDKIIPVVKHFGSKPQYTLYTPHASIDAILSAVYDLDKVSSVPVEITDVDKAYAENFLSQTVGWEKKKTSDDVIQQADKLTELKGRNFSSLRNTLKHVREDLRPLNVPLRPYNYQDALQVFNQWKETQGQRYFRVTIGRDLRLIEEYKDRTDFEDFFGFIHYIADKPVACSFGCTSAKDPSWGVDVTCKALPSYKGMGDFAFIYLMQALNTKGVKLVNDSGGQGNVLKNKLKFGPLKTIPMYDLARKS